MDFYELLLKLAGMKFLQDLTLVLLIIANIRSHLKKVESSVDGIRLEIHDLKSVFRGQDKRIANIEGTQVALQYQVSELQTNFSLLNKEEK